MSAELDFLLAEHDLYRANYIIIIVFSVNDLNNAFTYVIQYKKTWDSLHYINCKVLTLKNFECKIQWISVLYMCINET